MVVLNYFRNNENVLYYKFNYFTYYTNYIYFKTVNAK